MRKPLLPSTRLSAWILTMPLPTTTKAMPSGISSGMRKPWLLSIKPSAWILTMDGPTTIKVLPLRDLGRKQKRNKPTQEQDDLAFIASASEGLGFILKKMIRISLGGSKSDSGQSTDSRG